MNIKNTLLPIFVSIRRTIYIFLGILNTLFDKQAQNVFILSYHSVSEDGWRFSINAKEIKKQINYLSERFDIIDLKTLESIIIEKKRILKPSIVITFDDGYQDILRLKSFLKKKNIKPALFVLANSDNANWVELGSKRKFLNRSEILSLYKEGYEIGSHTNTHPNLSSLSKKMLEDEVFASKIMLEKNLGITIKYFAYPRGKYSHEVIQQVSKAGYKIALTMDDGFISDKTNPMLVPRIGVDRTHTFTEFKYLFSRNNINFRLFVKNSYLGRYL